MSRNLLLGIAVSTVLLPAFGCRSSHPADSFPPDLAAQCRQARLDASNCSASAGLPECIHMPVTVQKVPYTGRDGDVWWISHPDYPGLHIAGLTILQGSRCLIQMPSGPGGEVYLPALGHELLHPVRFSCSDYTHDPRLSNCAWNWREPYSLRASSNAAIHVNPVPTPSHPSP